METRPTKLQTLASTGCFLFVLIACESPLLAQPSEAAPAKPLVRRQQVQLTLEGAQRAVAASLKKAEEIGVAVNIAAVDDGGHLLAFARMDGARPGSVYTSITKATAAATKRGPTGPLRPGEADGTQLSLAVENAAAVSGGKFTSLKGGIPIVVDGQVIGAVGVGGATGEQDAEVATAGVEALTVAISDEATVSDSSILKNLVGNWLVEDIDGRGVIDNARTTLEIHADGTVTGSTGVNNYRTTVSTDDPNISFQQAVMTRRGGPPALMDQETRFVTALEHAAAFDIDSNGLLHLLNPDGEDSLRCSRIEGGNK